MSKNKPIVIKKYPNRRLYNTEESKYITLDDLAAMIKDGREFQVIDIKTSEDLTRITMIQIILDHELEGYELLPMEFLKQMIRFYDHPLNASFSKFMLDSLRTFNQSYEQFNSMMGGSMQVAEKAEEWTKQMQAIADQNMNLWQNMFAPINGKKNGK